MRPSPWKICGVSIGIVTRGCVTVAILIELRLGAGELDANGSIFLCRCSGWIISDGSWKSSSGTSISGNGIRSSFSSSRLLNDELLERLGVLGADISGVSSGDEAVDVSADQFDQFIFKRTLVSACPVFVLGLKLSVLGIKCPRKSRVNSALLFVIRAGF